MRQTPLERDDVEYKGCVACIESDSLRRVQPNTWVVHLRSPQAMKGRAQILSVLGEEYFTSAVA
jgi:hypothetical protein